MQKLIILALTIVLASLIVDAAPTDNSIRFSVSQVAGHLRGKVLDSNGAVIPNITVIVEGQRYTRNTQTDVNGEYAFDLPPGIYSITSKNNLFYPARRAKFRIDADSVAEINLRPQLRVLTVATVITADGISEPITTAPAAEFEEPSLLRSLDPRLNFLIQYVRKRQAKHSIFYYHAQFSYDGLTLVADRMMLDSTRMTLHVRGHLVIEGAEPDPGGNKTVVNLSTGKLFIKTH